jgi:sorbitol/mannitol transport system substrate-binding protein
VKRHLGVLTLATVIMAGGAYAKTNITVATVNNPDMVVMKELSSIFMQQNPDISVDFQVLPDNVLRQSITQDVAVGAGRYDVVTVGPYEVQSAFAKNKWLAPLNPLFDALPADARQAYDLDDILKTIRGSLTVDGNLYALPFYGESSFTMYRKDLFDKAGLTMPERPTWAQIREFACKLNDPANGVYGIAMKGIPDYGQLAPFITLMHSFGAKWFDEKWHPQIDTPKFKEAFTFYVSLLKDCGEPGATSVGFNEALTLTSQGKAAIWVDATVASGLLQDPKTSKVVDKMGYALAPSQGSINGAAWLWTWALGIVESSKHKPEAFKFILWATSRDYDKLVAEKFGIVRMPPGTRYSIYKNDAYLKSAPFAALTLGAIESADMIHPAKDSVPYTGTAQVNIPEYASWAADFGQNFSAVVAGKMSIDDALKRSQESAEKAMKAAGYIKD